MTRQSTERTVWRQGRLALALLLLTTLLGGCKDHAPPPAAAGRLVHFDALVGPDDTLITLDGAAAGMRLYRSRDPLCQPDFYAVCDQGQMDRLRGQTVVDTALTLSQPGAWYTLETPAGRRSDRLMLPRHYPASRNYMQAMTSFAGRLYRVSGYSGSGPEVPVWVFSETLREWQLLTAKALQADGSPAFSRRWEHVVTGFNGRLWLFGGYDGTARSDVWSSADGVTWREETAAAGWSGRGGMKMTELDGKLWLIGGLGDADVYGDVWSSADGITWTLVAATPRLASGEALLPNGILYHDLVAKDGKLWLINGVDANLAPIDGIFTSSDGITWTRLASPVDADGAPALLPQQWHAATVLDGHVYLAGGALNGGAIADSAPMQDIWRSEDGVTWENRGPNPAIYYASALQYDHGFVAHRGRLVLEPIDSGTYRSSFVSVDGRDWQALEQEVFSKANSDVYVRFNDRLWHYGGNDHLAGGYNDTILASSDGLHWEKAADRPVDATGAGVDIAFGTVVPYRGRLWSIGGYRYGYQDDVWSSADGITWTLEADAPQLAEGGPAFPTGIQAPVIVFQDKLWIVGGRTGQYAYTDDVLSSTDGRIWERVADVPVQAGGATAFTPRHGTLVLRNGEMCLIGGYARYHGYEAGTSYPESWCTADGASWYRLGEAPDLYKASTAWFGGRLWMAFGGQLLVSDDGVAYAQVNVAPYADMRPEAVQVFAGRLFAYGSSSSHHAANIWVSDDGLIFRRLVSGAFFAP